MIKYKMSTNHSQGIRQLLQHQIPRDRFSEIDIQFAGFLSQQANHHGMEVFIAAALVSRYTTEGHVCLNLCLESGKEFVAEMHGRNAVVNPSVDQWRERLLGSGVVGTPGQYLPLILDNFNRLYLYRYWRYEKNLAEAIRNRSDQAVSEIDRSDLKRCFARLFPETGDQFTGMQKIAVLSAVMKPFCVISGGPGTGKTRLVAKILALLLEQNSNLRHIYLAAPTGKAAAKLKQTLLKEKSGIEYRQTVKTAIPAETYTLHRLLKPISSSSRFRYNSKNRLKADLVIVDEVSMADMAMVARLVEAMPDHARLILVGDKDQLASVESGSVLGDICEPEMSHRFSKEFSRAVAEITGEIIDPSLCDASQKALLKDCITVLDKSFRFPDDGDIAQFSRLVNTDSMDDAMNLLKKPDNPCLTWKTIETPDAFYLELEKTVRRRYTNYFNADGPDQALEWFEQFIILCPTRKGPYGVERVNVFLEAVFRRMGLIREAETTLGGWYAGRPVLITRNNYALSLFNGDIGVTLPEPGNPNQDLWVFFPGHDSNLRRFSPARLADHETAFAMTVHKSQGSEFDHVLLVLPDQDTPVLSRELVYTAITRAKKSVTIWGAEAIIRAALSRKIQRFSGLRDTLWGKRHQE